MRKKPLPRFDTMEEAAEFWDNHCSEDYEWAEAPVFSFAEAVRVYSNIKVEPDNSKAPSIEVKKRRTTAERLANRILREKLKVA